MTTQVLAEPGSYQSIDELLAPRAPFDDRSFDELKGTYNFQQTSDWVKLFVRLLIKECQRIGRPIKVLDIGCGVGIGRSPDLLKAVRRHTDELWGLEPDPTVKGDPEIFANFQNATMEGAQLPENYFDLAFSFMVMEHVADPVRYLKAVERTLKPGGTHFFVTVNGHHYFTRTALAMKTLKIDEVVLRLLRGKHVEDYHYPVQYRCNKPAAVERLALQTGFEKPEFVFIEEDGPKPYFPGPLRPLWMMLQWKRKVIRNPRSLLTLVVRMTKKK